MAEYPRHLPHFDYVGPHRYFLTFCTHERRKIFVHADSVALVHGHILRACLEGHFVVHVYCYMPDHLHLLLEGVSADSVLKRTIARAKQFSGYYYKQAIGELLWQRYGYERVLRADEDTRAVARYIVTNPTRAMLVSSLCDYPYWGSSTWTREELVDYVRAG